MMTRASYSYQRQHRIDPRGAAMRFRGREPLPPQSGLEEIEVQLHLVLHRALELRDLTNEFFNTK